MIPANKFRDDTVAFQEFAQIALDNGMTTCGCSEDDVDWRMYSSDKSSQLVLNRSDMWASREGKYLISVSASDCNVKFVERYFANPLRPTPDECILFELEIGFTYLLKGVE